MKLEDQCANLELSKRLKELGVKQESLWAWYEANDGVADEPRLNRSNENCPSCTLMKQSFEDKYSAFSVAELGELLPCNNILHKLYLPSYDCPIKFWGLNIIKTANNSWSCEYSNAKQSRATQVGSTMADVLAKMLIHLLENNLIPHTGKP